MMGQDLESSVMGSSNSVSQDVGVAIVGRRWRLKGEIIGGGKGEELPRLGYQS